MGLANSRCVTIDCRFWEHRRVIHNARERRVRVEHKNRRIWPVVPEAIRQLGQTIIPGLYVDTLPCRGGPALARCQGGAVDWGHEQEEKMSAFGSVDRVDEGGVDGEVLIIN